MRPNLYLFTKDLTTCSQSAKNLQTTKASHTYTVSDSYIQKNHSTRSTEIDTGDSCDKITFPRKSLSRQQCHYRGGEGMIIPQPYSSVLFNGWRLAYTINCVRPTEYVFTYFVFSFGFFFLLPTDIVGGNGELVCNVSDGAMDNDEERRPHLHQPQLI